MRFLPLPCHGIDLILSASSLLLMIKEHATIDGNITKIHACIFQKNEVEKCKTPVSLAVTCH